MKKLGSFIRRNRLNIAIGIIFVLMIVIILLMALAQSRMSQQIANQTRILNQHSQDITAQNNLSNQIIALAKSNKLSNQQTLNAVRCLGTVFAAFTHNYVPVNIKDYDTCTLEYGDKTITTPTSTSTPQSYSNSQPSDATPEPIGTKTNTQGSASPPQHQNFLNKLINQIKELL